MLGVSSSWRWLARAMFSAGLRPTFNGLETYHNPVRAHLCGWSATLEPTDNENKNGTCPTSPPSNKWSSDEPQDGQRRKRSWSCPRTSQVYASWTRDDGMKSVSRTPAVASVPHEHVAAQMYAVFGRSFSSGDMHGSGAIHSESSHTVPIHPCLSETCLPAKKSPPSKKEPTYCRVTTPRHAWTWLQSIYTQPSSLSLLHWLAYRSVLRSSAGVAENDGDL